MKNYKQYLVESEKTYKFKIKVADDVTDEQVDDIEKCLQAFDVVSVSKPKRLPIQDNPAGFDGLGAVPVYILDVELKYPTTDEQLKVLVVRASKLPATHVLVTTEMQDEQEKLNVLNITADEDGKPILTQDYPAADPKVKELYGDSAVKISLKDVDDKKLKYQYAKANKEKAQTTNDLKQGTSSPVGTTKNKIPDVMKLAKKKVGR